jgi:quercetin dioxygenase-like cupin family protein
MFADEALRCECGYEVRALDEAARVEEVLRHASEAHGIELPADVALDVVRRVTARTEQRRPERAIPHPERSRSMIRGRSATKRARLIVGTAFLLLVTAAAVNVVPSAAVDPPPPPISAETLTARSVFPDQVDMKLKLKSHDGATTVVNVGDPSRTVVVRYTVQPGARFPWHTHYGPVIVNIVFGSLTYIEAGTCHETTYPAGQAFVDAGHGHVHSAYNPGTEPMVLIATFFEAPETGALLIPADPAC